MRHIVKSILLMMMGAIVFQSCEDWIEPEIGRAGSRTEEEVIRTYSETEATLNVIYTFLPNGFFYINGEALLACAGDEAEFTSESNPVQKFNTGAWNAIDNPDNAWQTNYAGIYAANLFLQKSDSINLDHYKYDPSKYLEYQQTLSFIKRWKYEARFLRAFFYFELIKRYGGVPILKEPLGADSDFANIPRSPLCDVVQFILDECDSVAENLPINYTEVDTVNNTTIQTQHFGRATRGAALSLKCRLLLYAASDLWNSPDEWAAGYAHPEWISMTDDKTRQERWEEAAKAAYDVMNTGEYALSPSTTSNAFGDLFRTFNNKEIIFARRYGSDNSFEWINYPIGFNGRSGVTPLGNLADDFLVRQSTSKAVPFDWTNAAHAADPFNRRDPRMFATVFKNGDAIQIEGIRSANPNIEIWNGGADGKNIPGTSKTGYYLNKYIDPTRNLLLGQSSVHTWLLFRYGEILLNYAEAVNEAYGPVTSYPGAGKTPNEAVSDLRKRATMPEFRTSATRITDPAEMRSVIRQERRVELALEDHRIWDVRRWMIAPETLGAPARGIEAVKNDDGSITYSPVTIENRVWSNKMYFYPIPLKDLKIEKGWEQNPGWQ